MSHTDPTQLFQSAVAALRNEDWPGVANHCDTTSLQLFRRSMVEPFTSSSAHVALTAEMLMKHSPDMPRAAAECQVAQHQQHANPNWRLGHEFPTVASVDVLLSLKPAEVFAAWLEGRSPRQQIARLVERGQVSPEPRRSHQCQ